MNQKIFPSYSRILIFAIVAVLFLGTTNICLAEAKKSLYERLGGYNAISAVIDEFLQRVWDDSTVGRYFVGMGTDTRDQLRQKNKNLLCFNTGGPCRKINRPLNVTHEGLGITDKEFDIVMNHLAETLKEFKVPQQEQEELMTKVSGLRPYVVEMKNGQ